MRRVALILTLTLLVGAGCWAYLYAVLDPNWRAQTRGSEAKAYHSDLYQRWLGTRLVLTQRADPYSEFVTKQIRRGVNSRPDASSRSDDAFTYPAHVMLVVAPLAMLPFPVASAIFSAVLFVMALSLVPLFMFCLGQKWDSASKWMATLVLFASYPLALALYVQQFTVIVVFALAAGAACLVKQRHVAAGVLFAISTIKPQFTVVMLPWLLLWTATRWRTRRSLLLSFLATATFLALSPELLVSGWFTKWLGAAGAFLRYPNLKMPAEWLLPGSLAYFATLAALVPAFVLLWRLRDAHPGEERFGFAVAVALAATLIIVPIWPALQYNHLLLIPAMLVIACKWTTGLSGRGRMLSFLVAATSGFSSVGALLVSLAVLVFRVRVEQLGHAVELPLFNFAIVPLLVPIALAGVLWNAAARGETKVVLADAVLETRR